MSKIWLKSIEIANYRSFGEKQIFDFPDESFKYPVAIVGYNNTGKTNLMNAILYGIGEKFVAENTFEKNDLHNLDIANQIQITTELDGSYYPAINWSGEEVSKSIKGFHTVTSVMEDGELSSSVSPSFYGANKHYNVFYINFHDIKDQLSTQKTSWGNLKSFLAKHLKKIIDSDHGMAKKKIEFENKIKEETGAVVAGSRLDAFIGSIKHNYSQNLRNNACEVTFGLPDYEDIFLQMIFRIGLNGSQDHLVPVDHFGDGYISMFVMAVIQAIAETETEDQCLFLFEEPESFLHENHQEYFYKMVLRKLTDRGHQVIYTTHSDRMVDIFNTRGLIRLEMDDKNQTVKKYNDVNNFPGELTIDDNTKEVVTLAQYNEFIKTIEPNLNRILFSKKVILVEGPNDLMVYKYAIEKIVEEKISSNPDIEDKRRYAETYLNFNNFSIIPHYGKITAVLLIELCKHLKIEFFAINDWDLNEDFIAQLAEFESEKEMKESDLYVAKDAVEKGKTTTNWKLINHTKGNIHFNVPKLETIIGYSSDDKNSVRIWSLINNITSFDVNLFPESLKLFLELGTLDPKPVEEKALTQEERALLDELGW